MQRDSVRSIVVNETKRLHVPRLSLDSLTTMFWKKISFYLWIKDSTPIQKQYFKINDI